MKKTLFAVLLVGAFVAQASAADVGVSISVGQPGFFGQINIGSLPAPQLIYTRPVVIQRAPDVVLGAPIYLHVRPGYERHWREHCAQYHACGRPVYFVRDDWYNHTYVPYYRNHGHARHDDHRREYDHGHGDRHGHDERHDQGNGHDRGERHDHDNGHDHGNGHGHGDKHDRGHDDD